VLHHSSANANLKEEARRLALKQRAEQTTHSETLGWEEEEEGKQTMMSDHLQHPLPSNPLTSL